MTTSTHTADTLDTVEVIVSRAILTGQLLPSMRAWALCLGNKDRAALLSFLAGMVTPTTTPDTSSSTTTHTPGPWRFDDEQGVILATDWKPVAFVSFHAADSLAQEEANGHLIAAAPELLQALREIADDYEDRFDLNDPSTNPGIRLTIKRARAAIATASTRGQA